jgi:membrane protease YdiL (CAAX protease family)
MAAQLLVLPLVATVVVPTDWGATTAFVAAVAIAFEARRAAKTSVRWIDDPAEDIQRDTSVWRALLAVGVIFFVQGALSPLLGSFAVSPGYQVFAVTCATAVAIALLMRHDRHRVGPLPWRVHGVWQLVIGALAGAAAAVLVVVVTRWLFTADGPAIADSVVSRRAVLDSAAMWISMTLLAPLAEEALFRGWLQRAIASDLPPDKRRWAFVLAAVAFALCHFGTYGLPQLLLGLVAGALFQRTGTLLPGVFAHAVYNGVLLWLGLP